MSEDPIDTSNEYSESMYDSIGYHYYLEMPGAIVESNADYVDGNKAEWHLSGVDAFTIPISAKSEVPALPIPTPGFSGILAMVSIIGAIVIFSRCKY